MICCMYQFSERFGMRDMMESDTLTGMLRRQFPSFWHSIISEAPEKGQLLISNHVSTIDWLPYNLRNKY